MLPSPRYRQPQPKLPCSVRRFTLEGACCLWDPGFTQGTHSTALLWKPAAARTLPDSFPSPKARGEGRRGSPEGFPGWVLTSPPEEGAMGKPVIPTGDVLRLGTRPHCPPAHLQPKAPSPEWRQYSLLLSLRGILLPSRVPEPSSGGGGRNPRAALLPSCLLQHRSKLKGRLLLFPASQIPPRARALPAAPFT